MKKICVFIGSRANYSSIKSVMLAIQNHDELILQLVVGASAVLDRFGSVVDLIVNDGFTPDYSFFSIVEGENPTTMAKSTGLGIIELSLIFDKLKPDYVVVVGDRFEMMSVTIAASYMNIRIVHTMGGEVTGTIDESIRHAITKFSHLHFPANEDAKNRIIRMGEDSRYVHNFGCPRIDLVAKELNFDSILVLKDLFTHFTGVGPELDLKQPFILVSQHPVTTEFGSNREHIEQTLIALSKLQVPTIMLWPNIDAGSDELSRGIRIFRENFNPSWLHVFKNLPTSIYIHLMNLTACLVGNSSSGIREGAYIGTPVVNIGTRQNNRAKGENVINSLSDSENIYNAIIRQMDHGKYPMNPLYGDGNAGGRIANCIALSDPPIQKTICY